LAESRLRRFQRNITLDRGLRAPGYAPRAKVAAFARYASVLLGRSCSRARRILGVVRLQGIVVAVLAFEYVTIYRSQHLVEETVHGFANEIAQIRSFPGHDV